MSKNKSIFRFVPGFIRRDFIRKIIALFFAVLIWARVSAQLGDKQIFRDLPVTISLPSGYILVNETPITTDLTLKSSKQQLLRLTPVDLNVSIKIKKPFTGKKKITITKKDITLPPGVFIERIERKVVILDLDKKVEKKVSVRLNITGALLDDYTFAVATMIPSEVRISGPESIINPIREIQAAPIALSKENVEDFECELKLRVTDGVTASPKTVTAKVDIFKKFDSRAFDLLPIKPYGFMPKNSRSVELDLKTASVKVVGLKQAVELLTTDDLHSFVDISKIEKTGEYTLSVQCWVGVKNVSVKEIKPKTVQVIIR